MNKVIKYISNEEFLLENDFKFIGDSHVKQFKSSRGTVAIEIVKDIMFVESIEMNFVDKNKILFFDGEKTRYATKNDIGVYCPKLLKHIEEVNESKEIPEDTRIICYELLKNLKTKRMTAKERELTIGYLIRNGLTMTCIQEQIKK